MMEIDAMSSTIDTLRQDLNDIIIKYYTLGWVGIKLYPKTPKPTRANNTTNDKKSVPARAESGHVRFDQSSS